MSIIKGGEGEGVRLNSGQLQQVINTYGSQVVDVFAHSAFDLGEALSIRGTSGTGSSHGPVISSGLKIGDQFLLWLRIHRPAFTTRCFHAVMLHGTASSELPGIIEVVPTIGAKL